MTHTPGPWAVKSSDLPGGYLYIISPSYRKETDAEHVVCSLRRWRRPSPEDNARLIAAAPELLSALRELVSYDEGSSEQGSYGYDLLARCRAAIAKATGRESE